MQTSTSFGSPHAPTFLVNHWYTLATDYDLIKFGARPGFALGFPQPVVIHDINAYIYV